MAARDFRATEEVEQLRGGCHKRVNTVMNGLYGRWFQRKIKALKMNDPFAFAAMEEKGETEEKLLTRVRNSMYFHCNFFATRKTCDGVRNARFEQKLAGGQRVFPAKISPKDPNCFSGKQDASRDSIANERCAMVRCYRELVEKNCYAVVPNGGESTSLTKYCVG